MTTTKSYIPTNASDFNDFQANLNTEVTANAVAWNIPAAQATELSARSTAFIPIHAAITNKTTRSRQQLIAYREFQIPYVAFLRGFCQSFLTNNVLIPLSVRTALGLNPRGLNPPSKRPKIDTAPIVALVTQGGASVRFGFKVEASNKRNGRHPLSNGVNVFYRIVGPNAPVPPAPPVPPVPDPTPDQPEANTQGLPTADGFEHYFSTKATFTRQLALSDLGKVLHVYAQWVNTTNPQMNSQFSMVATVVIG